MMQVKDVDIRWLSEKSKNLKGESYDSVLTNQQAEIKKLKEYIILILAELHPETTI